MHRGVHRKWRGLGGEGGGHDGVGGAGGLHI